MKSAEIAVFIFKMMILVMVGSCSTTKDEKTSKKVSLYLGQGVNNLMNKEYTEALKNLSKANQLDPENSEILNNLGMAYYFKEQKELAIAHLKKAIEFDEKNSDAQLNLASIHYQDGKTKEAEKLYLEVIKNLTYDKLPLAYYNLGLLEFEKKNDELKAEEYFKKSIKEDENYCPSYFKLGIMKYKNKKYKTALKYFKEASMGVCYEIPEPLYYQAVTLIKLRMFDEARLKLDLIETKFKRSSYALKARKKIQEINNLGSHPFGSPDQPTQLLESRDF